MELRGMDASRIVNPPNESDLNQSEGFSTSSQDILRPETTAHQATTSGPVTLSEDKSKIDTSRLALPLSQSYYQTENLLPNAQLASQSCREFYVPLSLITQVRNIYDELLRKNQEKLNSIEVERLLSPRRFAYIDTIFENLRKLCDYSCFTYLDHFIRRQDDHIYQAKYAENISTKFMFVVEFLNQMKPYGKIILIITRQDLVDIFEAIFKKHEYVYYRANQLEILGGNIDKSEMRVILALTPDEINNVKHADVIIAFDSSYFHFLKSKRFEKGANFSNSTILLHLIISYSIEHLERILDSTSQLPDDKFSLIKLMCKVACGVGTLPRGYPSPPDSAKLVSQFLLERDSGASWPLPPLPEMDVRLENFGNARSSTLPRISEVSKSSNHIALRNLTSVKRLLESDSIETFDSPKRRKSKSPAKKISPKLYAKQISTDSKENGLVQFQDRDEVIGNDMAYNQNINDINTYSRGRFSLLEQKISALEAQLRKKEETETELRQINQELQSHNSDMESSIRVIQPRFQEALNDRGLFEYEKELATKQEKSVRSILELREAAIAKCQQEKTIALKELKETHEALLGSSIPDVAEFEKMQREISALKYENELLQKQKKTIESDYDYIKSNYQNASTSAASLAQQILTQEKEIDSLKIKASENAVRIHQIQQDNTLGKLQLVIQSLRAEKMELERHLERLSEQQQQYAATVGPGRPNTRGNSVPRSPRLGTSCLSSPRLISRVISATTGNRSRGSSPAFTALEQPQQQYGSGNRGVTNVNTTIAIAATTSSTEACYGNVKQQQRLAEKPNMKRFGTHLQ